VLPGRGPAPKRHGIVRRVPAPQVEALVAARATALLQRSEAIGWDELGIILRRVEIRDAGIHLLFDSAPFVEPHETPFAAIARLQEPIGIGDQLAIDADGLIRLVCDGRPVFRGGRTWRRDGDGATRANRGSDPALATLLKSAHAMLGRYKASPLDPASHVDAEAPVNQRDRRLMSLGMLAPDIQKAILERKAPVGLTANKLLAADLPIAWGDQCRLFGFVG
jgi:hypothetical protein